MTRHRRALCGLIVSSLAAGAAPGVAYAAAAPAGSPKLAAMDPAKAKKTAEQLVAEGRKALDAGQYALARDHFSDVLEVEKKNVRAFHGLALAYVGLNDLAKARDAVDKAIEAGGLDRALALNAAVVQIGAKNPMRGAKVLMNYLQSQGGQGVDESVLNALAVALRHADEPAKRGSFYKEAEQFYHKTNQKLEGTKPGQKRWGVTWLPSAEVAAKTAANQQAQVAIDRAAGTLAHKQRVLADAEAALAKAIERFDRGNATRSWVVRHESTYDYARTEYETALDAYNAALATKEHQPFPEALAVVPMDDTTGATFDASAIAALANATPAVKPAENPAPRPRPRPTPPPDTGEPVAPPVRPKPTPPPVPVAPAAPTVTITRSATASSKVTRYAAAFPVGPNLLVAPAASVEKARTLHIMTSDGSSFDAEVVRKDEASGLALIKATGAKLLPMPLAADFRGGLVQCPAYARVSIFEPRAELLAGSARNGPAGVELGLARHPRLPGSPLLSAGRVVGVELAARDSDARKLPAVTLERLRTFLGEDAPNAAMPAPADPCEAVVQLTVVSED